MVMLTLPGAIRLPPPSKLSAFTKMVPASAKMGASLMNGTASIAPA